MSSVAPSKSSETGGLQGTALNLGASLGTALIGAILIVGLINGFNSRIADNPQLPESLGAVAAISLFALWFTRKLPTGAVEAAQDEDAAATASAV